MKPDPNRKYRPVAPIGLDDRTWPGKSITRPPIWCSVDLRDGNQALIEPMDAERKLRMFNLLVKMGYKEIEVGFPAASQTDFDFVRLLVEERRIPDDVTVQVLTQAREPLIKRTYESLKGAKRAIMHLYNSTSTTQRRVVFGLPREGIVDIAVTAAKQVRDFALAQADTDWVFQYSPESFTGTELDFAKEICDAVTAVWAPHTRNKMILNLPATVEMSSPNVFADQIEWMHRHLERRERIVLSVHPHNDRGCGVAAAELAQMAGADRVEGCLFGNGERTGNVCLVTLGLNLYTQGIDPGIDFSDINEVIRTVEHCNQLPVHPRHPYGGDLVFTAFSGSHQDAIKKGLAARAQELAHGNAVWDVPVPADRPGRRRPHVRRRDPRQQPVGQGRHRVPARAGPRARAAASLQIEFSQVIQRIADATGKELASAEIRAAFDREYVVDLPLAYRDHRAQHSATDGRVEHLLARLSIDGRETKAEGDGNGPVDAFVRALRDRLGLDIHVQNYHEHATGGGEDATAVAYVQLRIGLETTVYGVGLDANIVTATLKAVVSAVNRAVAQGVLTMRAVNVAAA
jgi:2-isopropylmalate synthase